MSNHRGRGKGGGQQTGGVGMPREDIQSIAEAVSELLRPNFDNIEKLIEDTCVKKVDFQKVKSNLLKQHYEMDGLKQYMKRENLRVCNFKPEGDLTDAVVDLFNHMAALKPPIQNTGADGRSSSWIVDSSVGPIVERSDISTCHMSNPSKPGAKPQILVRFISRQVIRRIYLNKRKLKSSPNEVYRAAYITDDVTPLRLRLKNVVSNIQGVEKCFIKDGNIHCDYKKVHKILYSPDDIFNVLKVDITDDMLKVLGVTDYL